MKRAWTLVAAMAVALVAGAWRPATGAAPGEGAVTSLSVVPTSGRAEVLIGVNGPVSVQDFTLRGPDKIVVDITGASLGMPHAGYDQVARGGIVDVRYSQYRRNIVRVVLTLDAPHHYTISRDHDGIHVAVDGAVGSFAAWHVGEQLAKATVHVVDAPAPATAKPAEASATPEVTPAPAPAKQAPALVPVKVSDPETVPVRPVVARIQQRAQQPRITINWENADIRDVLAAFSSFSGRTIIPSKGVDAKVTANINDQPWDVALHVVLNAYGLDAVEDPSGILIVDTQDHIAARQAAEPLLTRTFRLNYAKAVNIKGAVEARLSRSCRNTPQAAAAPAPAGAAAAGAAEAGSPTVTDLSCPVRGAVTVDSTTNSISITDVPGNMDALEKYAKGLDLRQPQVNIKAKIILVDRTSLEQLGLKYDLGSANQYFNDLVPRLDSTGTPETGPGRILLGGNTISAIANASQSVPGAALKAVYSAAMGGFSLTSFIEALQTISLLDVQAEPSVTTLNNRVANLTAGTQVPIRVIDASSGGTGGQGTSSFPRATVQFRQTGIILNVTPQITNNRQIQMKVHAENSDVQFQTSDVGAVFPTQTVDNEMLVADGETAVMGGLTQTTVTVSKSGIPILVDLPILGRLFGYTSRQETKRDLLILITPHIIDDGQPMSGDGNTP